ncbi:MAG: hypothetical protein AB7O52_13625 [Planctomycetota bacterium]
MTGRKVTLLGPQGERPNLRDVLAPPPGGKPLAVVTAGWQEREHEVEVLDHHLGRPTVNLALYRRSDEVLAARPDLRRALRDRKVLLDRLQSLYETQLAGALDAVRTLLPQAEEEPDVVAPYLEGTIDMVRLVDESHLARVARVRAEFEAEQRYEAQPEIQRHREELGNLLAGCSALLVAGGHVLVLLNRLRLFGICDLIGDLPVAAWSAGAMALTERIVLFHHNPPQGHNNSQVAAPGLGICPGAVVFPHANRRLRLNEPRRVSLLARRFAPAACLAMDSGGWATLEGDRWRGGGACRRLTLTGGLEPVEARCR